MGWPKGRKGAPHLSTSNSAHSKRLQVMLTVEQLAAVDRLAERQGVARSVLVRAALDAILSSDAADETTPDPAAAA